MDGPGMSLFQGASSIHINNSAQDRLEEQEELEDQRRREEELKNKLVNAFDDLLDDDEASSVNSSGNFTLDAAQANENQQQKRIGLPPTYVESLNHLKEAQHTMESPKVYCETPKNHNTPLLRHPDEALKRAFSPHGAGDGQNNCYHHEVRGHLNGVNNFEARQEYMNVEQLKIMYEMRVKECQQLASQLEALDGEVESLRARLAAAVSERDQADRSLQEAHHLLESSKHKLLSLEQQVNSLTQQLTESVCDKEQLRLELRACNAGLQEATQRMHEMKVAHTHNADVLFRESQDRHREEMDRLQNDLIKAKNRLEEKENEVKTLEKRCMEKDRGKEEILIEKGATINRLAAELEAAQSRLVGGETARLKERVGQLTSERNAAKEQVKELGSKLEVTAHELVLCRSKLTATQQEHEAWRTALHQILRESLPDHYIGEPPSPGKLTTLKEVLSRHKQQAHKLTSLQDEIAKKDKKIEQHRKQECELRAKVEEYKSIEMQLTSKVCVLQSQLRGGDNAAGRDLLAELNALQQNHSELELEVERLQAERARGELAHDANGELLRELERCGGELRAALKDSGELKTLYIQACSARDAISRELKDHQSKAQKERELYKTQEADYIHRIEREKQQVEKLTAEQLASKEELERANRRISELQKEFNEKQKEFTDKLDQYLADEKSALRKEMDACAQCEKHLKHIRCLDEQLAKCSLKLATHENNEELMEELKGKAEFFQQYIMERLTRLRSQRTVGTGTDGDIGADNVDTDDDKRDLDAETVLMMKEKAIRDQIAEKYTLEIKTVEMNCARRVKEAENEHLAAVTKLKELLERKAKEVDALKEFILGERAKVTKVLESKESEISSLIRDHNEIQAENHKAHDQLADLRHKVDRYKEKLSRLASLEEVIKSEKDEWKAKAASHAKEVVALRNVVAEMQNKPQGSEQARSKCEQCKAYKRTINTYKSYMSKKDAHLSSEVGRIQDEYRRIFVQLQTQLQQLATMRAQYMDQYDYTEKMNKLNEDFAKLAREQFRDSEDDQ